MKKLLCLVLIILTLCASFAATGAVSFAEGEENPFTDVAAGRWFTEAVLYCYRNGYMTGTTATKFSPGLVVSRAQMVRVMANLAEADLSEYTSSPFTDVPEGKWYTPAVVWAAQNGITGGTGEGRFSPDASVTREQLAVFFYSFAGFMKYDTSMKAESLLYFYDRNKISSWALEGVEWAVEMGLISGTADYTLSPKTTCTRAQLAVIIMKFADYYSSTCEHDWTEPTCTEGRECRICGYKRGTPLGHTTTEGICERCHQAVFSNKCRMLHYYVWKNGTPSQNNPIYTYISGDSVVNGVRIYCDVFVHRYDDTHASGVDLESLWYYDDDSVAYVQIHVPYPGTYYNFKMYYAWGENEGEEVLVGAGGFNCNKFNSSTAVRFSQYDLNDGYKADWEKECAALIDGGLKVLSATVFGKDTVGGVTLKDLGFFNY